MVAFRPRRISARATRPTLPSAPPPPSPPPSPALPSVQPARKMVANGAEAVADGVAEAVDSLPLGKPARKMARRCTLQGARLVWRSIRHMIAFVSMDDLYSLIDQLLLLSTLMAGFAVALMTGSSVGLEEFAQADSFNFRATFIDNDLEEDMVTINSHELLWNGQLASACFFTSIATGVSTYLNLNLSRAREDQELGKRFAGLHLCGTLWLPLLLHRAVLFLHELSERSTRGIPVVLYLVAVLPDGRVRGDEIHLRLGAQEWYRRRRH